MNKSIYTATAVILTIATLAIIIPTTNVAFAEKSNKDIKCDGCTLRFSGKNDVTITFPSGTGGGGTGSQGPKGDTGATGATGPQGEQGIQGLPGAQGPAGETGPQGQAGVNGTNGISGVSGTNGTVLDNQTINNLQWVNDNVGTLKEIVAAWNNGTLGVPSEVPSGNVTENVTTPAPVENVTTPIPPVANETTPLPPINVTTPENVTGNVPINVTGNLTVPGGNFSGDVNVTLPNASEPIGPQESNQSGNITQNATLKTFGGSVIEQIFGN